MNGDGPPTEQDARRGAKETAAHESDREDNAAELLIEAMEAESRRPSG